MSEQMAMPGLAPTNKGCPYCGHNELKCRRVWKEYWFIACEYCRQGGPVRKTKQEAWDAYNNRAERTCYPVWNQLNSGRVWPSCSECGNGLDIIDGDLKPYCAHCGSKVVDE